MVLFLICCIFTSANLIAQLEDKSIQNSVQLSIGINQIKDKNLHPKVHTGAIYTIQYNHSRTKKNHSTLDFSFSYGQVKTVLEEASNSLGIQLNGSYGYLFRLDLKDKFTYFLGPKLAFNYRLSHYPMWDDSHLYWADDFSLEMANIIQYSFQNNTALVGYLDLSVFSVFSRPKLNRAYKIDDVSLGGIIKNMHSNFDVGTFNKAFNLDLGIEYQFKIAKKITQAICYSFNYHRFKAKEGMAFSNLQHNLGLKLYF